MTAILDIQTDENDYKLSAQLSPKLLTPNQIATKPYHYIEEV